MTLRVGLDINCSPKTVAALNALYRSHALEFLHLATLVCASTPDVEWPDALRRAGGSIVLSGDAKIAYRPHEAAALKRAGLHGFFFGEPWGRLPRAAKDAVVIFWWPRIRELAEQHAEAGCWHLSCSLEASGELRIDPRMVKQLTIPPGLLA